MADIKTKKFKRPSHWTLAQTLAHFSAPPNERGCVLWRGRLTVLGYGCLDWHGKTRAAHRFAWMNANGDIPPGMEVCHRCDVRSCINPEHLFLGTHKDNMNDMVRKGRSIGPRGELQGSAKLTAQDVLAIRADPRTGVAIAADYGVDSSNVYAIKHRKSWQHL